MVLFASLNGIEPFHINMAALKMSVWEKYSEIQGNGDLITQVCHDWSETGCRKTGYQCREAVRSCGPDLIQQQNKNVFVSAAVTLFGWISEETHPQTRTSFFV